MHIDLIHKNKTVSFSCCNFHLAALILLSVISGSSAHPAISNSVGGSNIGTGSGVFQTAREKANDTASITIDVFTYLGHAIAERGSDGEPLGTGGKTSGTYNVFLYGSTPYGSPVPGRSEARVRYGEFGYIPLWQPNTFSSRIGYRFLPTLLGRVTFGCNLDQSSGSILTPVEQLTLGEVQCMWTPRTVKGLRIALGRHLWTGSYAGIFDQMPLEQFLFDGLITGYSTKATTDITLDGKLGAGRRLAGKDISYSDTSWYGDLHYLFQDKTWYRYHCLGKMTLTYKGKTKASLLAGYQRVPSLDTDGRNDSLPFTETGKSLPGGDGWHAGLELSGSIGKTDQHLAIAYGHGNVLLGWSSPPFTDTKSLHPGSLYEEFDKLTAHLFSREGSSLLHGCWWMSMRNRRFKGSAGLWTQYSMPAENKSTYIFDDASAENGFVPTYDTVSITAQPSLSLKGAADVSYRFSGPFHCGLRVDAFHYHSPDAHTNAFDFERSGIDIHYDKSRPAKWENEATDCGIVTPYMMINVANMLQIKAAYASAFYNEEVYRQGHFAFYHGNLIISTQLYWRFAKMKR